MMTNDREILIYHKEDWPPARRTIAHAKSISDHVKSFTYTSSSATNVDWGLILDALAAHPMELLDREHPVFKEKIEGKEFDREGWLNVLRRNPDIIQKTIAVRGNQAVVCHVPSDVHQLLDEEERNTEARMLKE